MQLDDQLVEQGISSVILVVDDDTVTRTAHRALLAGQFDVITAESGAQAIEICRQRVPDLILLDIDMPDLNGVETCRELRKFTTVPIVFVTGHESLDEHMRAYDAGGDDILMKPVRIGILLRKASLAIARYRRTKELIEERESLHKMAMNFLSSAGQNGALLNFMRASIDCRSYDALAAQLLAAIAGQGLDCCIMIRHPDGPTIVSVRGEPTELERSVLEHLSTMGRMFEFGKRLVANYDRVTIVVTDMPEATRQPELVGEIRDHVVILAETAEALCDNVAMRLESMGRAEQLQIALNGAVEAVESLRTKYHAMLVDTRFLVQELVEKVEKGYAWAGFTLEQEYAMSNDIDRSVKGILSLLAEGGDFEKQFSIVLKALSGGDAENKVELF